MYLILSFNKIKFPSWKTMYFGWQTNKSIILFLITSAFVKLKALVRRKAFLEELE